MTDVLEMSFARLRAATKVNAALATPFTPSGDVDWRRLCVHASGLLADGLASVTLFGTTGEGPSIAAAECAEAIGRMADGGIAAERLVQGVFQCAAADAASLSSHILRQGAAGVLLAPPFYFGGVSDEAVYAWFASVFDRMGSAARDVLLYNIPGLTRVALSPELVERLRRAYPQIVAGVKDSSGDLPATKRLLAAHKDLIILVGHEGHLAEGVRLGATGAISGIANAAPHLLAKLTRGEHDPRIARMIDALFAADVVPAIKALVAERHKDGEWARCRPPLQAVSSATRASLAAVFGDAIEPATA